MNASEIEVITVLGAGTMGHGIAEVAALSGYEVRLRDINEDLVQDGYEQIEWSLDKLAENEFIGEDDAEGAKAAITPIVDLEEAVGDADVVIEAIVEDMDVKKDVYSDLDAAAPDRTIFASNTSSLSITEIASATERPEQVCGMHFFNPPVRMDLVEVISGAETADETTETIADLAESLGKTPIHVHKDSPGFVVNRILIPLMNEASWMVSDGFATVAEIDSTTSYDMGHPMGAFELADQVGHDVTLHVLEYMHEELGDAYEPAPILEEKVKNDELGRKTGKGFYDYEDGGVDVPPDQGREDVADRLLATMANEIGKLRDANVAALDAIEQGLKLGAGYPEGPARTVDDAGLDHLIDVLEERHEATGAARYEVSDGLREAADAGGFHGGADGDETTFETIQVEYPAEYVGQIVLDRPQAMNTVTPRLLDEFATAVDHLDADDEVRAILVTGAGDRAFSAGADASGMAGEGGVDPAALARKGQQTWGKLEEASVPVVAGIDGFALGGGMELATCADLRVASDRSTFGQPERNLGIIPGWGGTQRLSHIIGEGRAREIILTGDHYDPETMQEWGFLTEVVDADVFEERALDYAQKLAGGPPLANEGIKRAMLAGRDDTDAGLEVEAQAFSHVVQSDDFLEGVSKMGSDEDPEFEGT